MWPSFSYVWFYCLLIPSLLALSPPHWFPLFPLNTPSMFLPQGLCTCCYPWRKWLPSDKTSWGLFQMSPQRSLPCPFCVELYLHSMPPLWSPLPFFLLALIIYNMLYILFILFVCLFSSHRKILCGQGFLFGFVHYSISRTYSSAWHRWLFSVEWMPFSTWMKYFNVLCLLHHMKESPSAISLGKIFLGK